MGSAGDALEQIAHGLSLLHRGPAVGAADLARLWVLAEELILFGVVQVTRAMRVGSWLRETSLADGRCAVSRVHALRGRTTADAPATQEGA